MKNPFNKTDKNAARGGFTLVEVLVASAISTLIVVAIIGSFSQYRRMMRIRKQTTEVQSNLRTGFMLLSRDAALTGYGMNMFDAQLPRWIVWATGVTSNPMITEGTDGASDALTLVAAYDRVAQVAQGVEEGATTLVVGTGEGVAFNTTDRGLVYIGGCELARVSAVGGDILTLSTHPELSAGLKFAHPAGATVERVRVVTYSVVPETGSEMGAAYLRRSIHRDGGEEWIHEVAVPGIEHIRVTREGNALTVRMRAVSQHRDPLYTEHEDQRRRAELSSTVHMRNIRLYGGL